MKTTYLITLFIAISQLVFGQEEPKQKFYLLNCTAENITIDKNDNLLIGGNYDIGSSILNLISINDRKFGVANKGFLCAKLNQKNEVLWVKTPQSNATFLRYPAPITLADDSSNVYLIGKFEQKLFIDVNNVLDSPTGDIFIIKYSSEGVFRWAKKIVGSSDDGIFTPKIDNNGNIFILGQFEKKIEFDGQQRLTGSNQPFVLKLDRNGKYIFAKAFNENLKVNALTLNNGGEMFIVGEFYGNVVFENNASLKSTGFQDIFYAKYDKNLQVSWVKTISGKIEDVSHNIEADKLGNIYIAGLATDDAVFDTLRANVQTTKGRSIFLSKIDAISGNVKWVKRMVYGDDSDPTIFNTVKLLKINNDGEAYMSGSVAGYLSINSQTQYKAGSSGGLHYIIKYSKNGDFLGGLSNPINVLDRNVLWKSIAMDSKSKLYISGNSLPTNGSYSSFSFISYSPNVIKLNCAEKNKVNIEWDFEKIFPSESITNLSDFNLQWYKNGEPIPKANQTTLQMKEPGYYSLKINNKADESCQIVSSNTVNILPKVLPIPANLLIAYGGKGDNYLYTSFPDADKIEWYLDGKLIEGASSYSYYYKQDGTYKIKKYFENNSIVQESNEVIVNAGFAVVSLKKDIFYDGDDKCKPVPYLRAELRGRLLNDNDPYYEIQWFLNGQAVKDSTKSHFKPITTGDYSVRVFSLIDGRQTYFSGKYKLVPEDFPKSLSIVKIEDNCGANALLKIDDSFMMRNTFQSIVWRLDDKEIANETYPFLRTNKGGYYTFSVKYVDNINGATCNYNSFVTFDKKPDFKPNVSYSYAGSGCVVDSFKVAVDFDKNFKYQWTRDGVLLNKATTNEIFVKDKNRYQASVVRADGCTNTTQEISLKGCTPDSSNKFLFLNPPIIFTNSTVIYNDAKTKLQSDACQNTNMQWLKDGKLIAGAIKDNIEVGEAGKYSIQIEKNGCVVSSKQVEIKVETILAVGEENPNFNIEVYPNPTEEKIFISIPQQINTPIDVKITDISGKLIDNYDFSASNSQFIDLKSLQVGVYFLVFDMQGKRVVKKIIKNN